MCSVFLLETFLFSPYVLSCKGSASVDAPMGMKLSKRQETSGDCLVMGVCRFLERKGLGLCEL